VSTNVVPLHPPAEYITESQRLTILDRIAARTAAFRRIGDGTMDTIDEALTERLFLQYIKVPSIAAIPASLYQRAVNALEMPVLGVQISPSGKSPETWPEKLRDFLSPEGSEPVSAGLLHDVAIDLYQMIEELQEKAGIPPTARRLASGRHPKWFVTGLSIWGTSWLWYYDVPNVLADFEKALANKCAAEGWDYSTTQTRKLAHDLINQHKAAEREFREN
jgi:hypothetical protein